MTLQSSLLATWILLLAGQPSGGREIVPGTVLDPRLSGCGLAIRGTVTAEIAPFMDGGGELSGEVRIRLHKRSAAGTSTVTQSTGFEAGKISLSIAVERPFTAEIEMEIVDRDGRTLCRLDRILDLREAPRNI